LNKLQFVQTNYNLFEQIVTNNFFHVSPGLRILVCFRACNVIGFPASTNNFFVTYSAL